MDGYDIEIDSFILPITHDDDEATKVLQICSDIFCQRENVISVARALAQRELYLEEPFKNRRKLSYSNPHILTVSYNAQSRLASQGIRIATTEAQAEGDKSKKLSSTELLQREDEISNLFTLSSDLEQNMMEIDIDISKRVTTVLKGHQRTGVLWMLRKEGALAQSTIDDPLKGGILADDMGMGKSLTTLALIVTSLDSFAESVPVATTLLICPKSVITSWEEQIRQHVVDLKYLVYFPSDWKEATPNFGNYDLVITTFGVVAYSRGVSASPVANFHWRRIVLDEAHIIRERSTNQAKAIFGLKADFRWCLTGTPVQNKLDDYGSLLQFLRYTTCDDRKKFYTSIIKPLKTKSERALQNLRQLISDTTLRRLKATSSLNLPPREDHVQRLSFSATEQDLHNLLHDFTTKKVQEAVRAGAKGSGVGSYITQLILRLRQVCNHGTDLLPISLQNNLRDLDARGGGVFAIHKAFRLMICEVCKEEENEDTQNLTNFEDCQHIICSKCVPEDGECPICVTAHQDMQNSQKVQPSTKVQALVDNLNTDRSAKKVVFSCWTKMLDLVEIALDNEGIVYTRMEGSLSMKERRQRIERFRNDGECMVLLSTLGSGSVGLDLTVASEVHLLEPQFNPMLEEQALARVHRIGQTKPVKTIRYIMKDSYEEQILKRQNQKLQLAELCASGTVAANRPLLKYLEVSPPHLLSISKTNMRFQ
ncbi:hypothetical protein ABW19_dt0208999 [Dactylella cylindrospora]|nr:hypothetical protein ABW19_dt0208999 [Dactylella cylindrospora]